MTDLKGLTGRHGVAFVFLLLTTCGLSLVVYHADFCLSSVIIIVTFPLRPSQLPPKVVDATACPAHVRFKPATKKPMRSVKLEKVYSTNTKVQCLWV